MKLLSPFVIRSLHFSFRPMIMFCIELSPSFCWLANNLSALIRFSQSPCGTACALKNFRFIFVCADLHYQNPVGYRLHTTNCSASSSSIPPKKVLQKNTVAMRADIRQVTPSNSTDRRNDSPQKIRVLPRFTVQDPNVQLLLLPPSRKHHVLFLWPIQMTSLLPCLLL